jgi:thiamine biosynthesis protein ThiS
LLGLPLEKDPTRTETSGYTCQATLKKVHINTQEYGWEISTLATLLTKWRDECSPEFFRNNDITLFIVAVNDKVIPAKNFSSMPISDGDEITIAAGMIGGGLSCHHTRRLWKLNNLHRLGFRLRGEHDESSVS